MTQIPDNEVTPSDMSEWWTLVKELARIKAQEMLLRRKIFRHFFPVPTEGTNSAALSDGFVLKGKYVINRKVDEGAFTSIKDKLREQGINPDALVRWKPELEIKAYRSLTAEQQKLVDQFLTVEPGSPALEVVKPAAKKEKQ